MKITSLSEMELIMQFTSTFVNANGRLCFCLKLYWPLAYVFCYTFYMYINSFRPSVVSYPYLSDDSIYKFQRVDG